MNALYYILLTCVLSVRKGGSVTKIWTQDTNYGNPNNWDLARVPCSTDRVIFPNQIEAAIRFKDGSTMVRELVLPSNGEMILPLNGSLTIGGDSIPKDKCPGQDIVFSRSWSAAWLDPANWKAEGRRAAEPVPHLERIPCSNDRIIFPEDSSFRVRLPEVTVTVGRISLLGQDMSPSLWREALLSEPGERQFVSEDWDISRISSVVMTGEESCPDKAGCACAGHPELQNAVCKHTRNRNGDCYNDGQAACVSPVQPLGHCCAFCGAYLLLEYRETAVALELLQSLLDSYLKQGKYSEVVGHIGKPAMLEDAPRNRLQIVLADVGDYRGDCVDLANTLAARIRNSEYFGVSDVDVYAAGEVISLSTWGSIVGTVFGTLAAVLIVMSLFYFVFIVYRQNGWLLQAEPFFFARFENAPSESEEAVESRIEVEVLPGGIQQTVKASTDQTTAAAFDNPMYGTAQIAERTELPLAESCKHVTHENPVYSELLLQEERGRQDIEDELTPEKQLQEVSDLQV